MLNTTAFVLGLALSDIRGYKMEAVEACCPQILINRMTTSPGLSECERRNPETHHNTPVEDESSFTSGDYPKDQYMCKTRPALWREHPTRPPQDIMQRSKESGRVPDGCGRHDIKAQQNPLDTTWIQ